jgi:Mg2+/Co2+ transporter CorB
MPDAAGFSLEPVLMVLAIVVLLALSALFNISETSLTAASRARMHALEGEGNVRATLVNRLLSKPEKLIGAVLIGNTLVDVMAAALATTLAVDLVGPAGVAYATGIVTLLIVIFSAVLPKTMAFAHPDRLALAVAPIMRGIISLLSPAIIAVEFVVRQLLKLTPSKEDDKANILAAHQELRGAIELQHKEGSVKKGDRDMLGGVLDLPGLTVKDIMVHRTKMQAINADDPMSKILDEVLKNQYTRMPVWRDDPENIIGVLNAKDIMTTLSAVGWNVAKLDIKALIKDAWFVPDTRNLKDQLNAFLRRKAHVALIVDEYGVVQGLVTLEDIIEEIVGQISDETDSEGPGVRVQADGMVIVDGSVHIRDLNRQMDWHLPDEEATTIAGLVIHEAQTIPEQGQAFTFHGFRFEILRKARNRITLVRIKPPVAAGAGAAAPKAPASASGATPSSSPAE